MKIKILIKAGLWGIAVLVLSACASEDTTEKNEQKQPEPQHVVASFTGKLPGPVRPAKSRTTATHTFHGPAKVSWTANDRIWVKATDGTWHRSEPALFLTADQSQANFKLTSGTYGFNPEVRYVGESNNVKQVTIPEIQHQATLGDFSHLGESGDCGTATAKGGGGDYEFTLQHKSAYICFYPRIQNEVLHHNVRLEKITVKFDGSGYDYLAGIFDFTYGTVRPNIFTINGSEEITLNTHSAPIPSSTRNDTCFYITISASYHGLYVTFEFKDPTTNITAYVTKHWTENFEAGQIYDYTVWLDKDIKEYKFYMWDAKFNYWYNNFDGGGYPKNNTDPRWYHEGIGSFAATQSCKDCPNANEMFWYGFKGDAHWGTSDHIFAVDGHLRKNLTGVWLKKKAKILADEGITEEQMKSGYPKDSPIDRRVNQGPMIADGVPSHTPVPNTTDYFFLPSISGYYYSGYLHSPDFSTGWYWSSSSNPESSGTFSYYLDFTSDRITAYYGRKRDIGMLAVPFE